MRKLSFSYQYISIAVIFLLVLTLAFFLSSRMILAGDFWFTPDQARDLLLAKGIVINHKPILIGARSGIEGVFHGPLWIYMISMPFALFHGNPHLISYFFIFISMLVV